MMTEFDLIQRFFNTQIDTNASVSQSIIKGIGDDASVIKLPSNFELVTCTDTLVQGQHFFGDWNRVNALAFAIGYKAVAVNVSDIVAMGAKPHSLLLALALPQRLANEVWLSEFAKGIHCACKEFDVILVGGDTTRCDTLVITVTAQGSIATGKAVYRDGAGFDGEIGDGVYVSGTVGDASYALKHLNGNNKNDIGKQLAHRLHLPTPRIHLGRALAQLPHRATAMIDVSDGLIQDLSHIAQQSGVRLQIDLNQLPTSKALSQVTLSQRLPLQLSGGDDYELAFTLPANADVEWLSTKVHDTPITRIGSVIDNAQADKPLIELVYKGNPVTLANPYPFESFPDLTGYQHF